MSNKELEITCPSCSSRLVVDVLTEKVVRSARPEERDEAGRPKVSDKDWSGAWSKVRGRMESGDSKLDAALNRERDRGATLDDLFRKASDKAKAKAEDAEDADDSGEACEPRPG